MSYDLGSAQRAFDGIEPDYEVEMPQIDAVEKAVEHLLAAARAYQRFIPAVSTGDGYVEEAMAELRKIVGGPEATAIRRTHEIAAQMGVHLPGVAS